jgi:6-phosphogluconolactonase
MADPCYIINDEKNVIVANYSGGNIAVFGKIMMVALGNPNKWFSIMEKEVMLKTRGATRSSFFPDRKFVLSNDLGMTRCILMNTIQIRHSIKSKTVLLLAGSGPRHTRRYVYYRNLLEV